MSRPGRVALVVAVASAAGAAAARDGGADRVELASALELGGLTPSLATIEDALEVGGPEVHVVVRPRPGDAVYDGAELRSALRDVVHAVRAGARGVVVGGLTASGVLDVRFLASVASAARSVRADAEVTLSRVIDHLPRPSEHVARLAQLGVTAVTTSGGGETALAGVGELARSVARGGPLRVVAAGGVGPASVGALVEAGVAGVHLTAERAVAAQLPSRVAVGLGVAGAARGAGGPLVGDARWVTDPGVVAATRAALDAATARRGAAGGG